MKISLNTIKSINQRYATTGDVAADGVDALAEKIGAQLGAIEEIEHIGQKYQGIIIAKVVQCTPHQNSDHLNVCLIDDGGVATDVERNADGLVQVVCGAPNVRQGLLVAWLPPGTTVPESVGKDPFVLGARELRGVLSNGMLASPRELALGDSHEGILEINDASDKVKPGDDFAVAYGLKDDVILDIENKMFTHRPDCFGFLGVSRELAGIQGMPFHSPDWYVPEPAIVAAEAAVLPLKVVNEIPSLVPRFMALAMRDVAVGPSPTWLVVELAKVGLRSINNIVDYTNWFMLLTGQPLHAYDYDKVSRLTSGDGAEITVRYPHNAEKIALLNGKEIAPRAEAIMIASGNHLIGVGGVMGGADTEVDETTTNIILEVASFDMYSIRRTAMAHGLFTDAVTRFNKGQSPLQNRAVLAEIVSEIRTYAAGKVASECSDVSQVQDRQWVHPPVPVTVAFINERLGFALSASEMQTLLQNVEFQVAVDGDQLVVTAPFWRTDIETSEDVVEEVGRLYGFDKLPLVLPQRSISPTPKDELFELKSKLRGVLAKAGANEVLTYSFVHGDLLTKAGQNPGQAFQVGNALSPDLQYYRLSLTPSLLDKIHGNIKAGYDAFALFELGKAHGKTELDESGLPREFERLALVFAAGDKVAQARYSGAAYYQARAFAAQILDDFTDITMVPLTDVGLDGHELTKQLVAPFEPGRSVVLYRGEDRIGIIGEYKRSVTKAFKLPQYCAGFELFASRLSNVAGKPYVSLPRFPKVTQDITLKLPSATAIGALDVVVADVVAGYRRQNHYVQYQLISLYQGEDTSSKNITYRLIVASYQKTLTDAEVACILDEIAAKAAKDFAAEKI